MFSIAFSSLFGQDAVHRRPAHAEGVGNRARRFAACVHPLCRPNMLRRYAVLRNSSRAARFSS